MFSSFVFNVGFDSLSIFVQFNPRWCVYVCISEPLPVINIHILISNSYNLLSTLHYFRAFGCKIKVKCIISAPDDYLTVRDRITVLMEFIFWNEMRMEPHAISNQLIHQNSLYV